MAEKDQKGARRQEENRRLFHDAQQLGIGGGTTVDLLELVDLAEAQVLCKALRWYVANSGGAVGARVDLDAALPRGGTLDGLKKLWAAAVKEYDQPIRAWLDQKELPAYEELTKKLLG